MTRLDTLLAEIAERAAKATPGPWHKPVGRDDGHDIHAGESAIAGNYDYEEGGIIEESDREFIIAARQDIPRRPMNPSEINQAIAQALGWTTTQTKSTWSPGLMLTWHVTPEGKRQASPPPDYHGDLNAIAQAERTLTDHERREWVAALWEVMGLQPILDGRKLPKYFRFR